MEIPPSTYTRSQYIPQKKNNQLLYVGIVVAIIVVAVGLLIGLNSQKPAEKKDVVVEKKEPTPTEKPKIEKASVKIQVLNGTGTAGQAGLVVKELESDGYSTDNIKSGNADSYDHTTATISYKTDFEDIASNIKEILQPTFDTIEVESTPLNSDSGFDIVIITGGKIEPTKASSSSQSSSQNSSTSSQSQSPTVTTTPTPTATITPTTTPTPTP